MTTTFVIIVALYGILILSLGYRSRSLAQFEPNSSPAEHSFSILVVFRNEAENLTGLMQKLKELNYPRDRFEVLLIDDDSEDGSLSLALKFRDSNTELDLKVLESRSSSSAPKKEALEKGVQCAKHPWIITTDADCSFGSEFLRAYDQYLQSHKTKFVAGPVTLSAGNSFLQRFQLLDFLSLQGSTMGSFGTDEVRSWIRPFMCNGANLCYERDAFLQLKGYEGNRHLASGDDVFLLEKMLAEHREEVRFIKSRAAVVSTVPKKSWKELVEQRRRWASKTSSYENKFGKGVGILVFLTNLALVSGLGLSLFGTLEWSVLGILFLIKINVDFVLIYATASFLDQSEAMQSYVASSFLYPFFVVYVALLSLTPSYQWKGRSFKK